MTLPLGKHQLHTLAMLGSPGSLMLVAGPVEMALVKRGLLKASAPSERGKAAVCISPAGLRALAAAVEAGLVDDGHAAFRKERERRAAAREQVA